MNKFNINIPGIIGIALAVTITTYQSDKIKEETKNPARMIDSNITFNEIFIPVEDTNIESKDLNFEENEPIKVLKK